MARLRQLMACGEQRGICLTAVQEGLINGLFCHKMSEGIGGSKIMKFTTHPTGGLHSLCRYCQYPPTIVVRKLFVQWAFKISASFAP